MLSLPLQRLALHFEFELVFLGPGEGAARGGEAGGGLFEGFRITREEAGIGELRFECRDLFLEFLDVPGQCFERVFFLEGELALLAGYFRARRGG